ncbi:TraB/GumN family protein [Litorimonas sp. RW-G-Af-16]|uniref:TraB/GumN family protein n=1 Tax=Litorimonas sp. RW-G-Af-16 TaxID=3241168 RepID=UPI00390C77BE
MKFLSMCLFAAVSLISTGCDNIAPTGDAVSEKVADARARNDGPAIWLVEDYDSKLYIFGTVHLLPDTLDWQREDMRQAFAEAGTVFFEVDTGEEGQIQAAVLTTSLGMRSDGLRLSDSLDNYQLKLLDAAANNGNLTVASLDSMKPWLASEFLTFAAATNAGLLPDLSADEALKSRAARSGKNVIYLETMEDQIRSSAELPEFVQLSMLTETMEKFNTLGIDMVNIANAWAVGRTDVLTQRLVQPMRERAPEVFNALLRDRNRAWSSQLTRFMEDSGTGFVAVGTAHLLGEESLLEEMREAGYTVSRYYAFQGDDVIEPINPTIERAE